MAKYTFSNNRSASGVTRTLGVLLVLSLALNIYLLITGRSPRPEPEVADLPEEVVDESAEPTTAAVGDEAETVDSAEVSVEAPGRASELVTLDLNVTGSLSQLFDRAVPGRRSVWLTAKTSRVLMWCMDLQKDMRAGDRLQMLYRPTGTEDIDIAAVRYDSLKMGKEFRAYFYKPEAETFGSFWDEKGTEVPARLKEVVLRDYEQITAVLGDGRDHRGYDFLAPVGSPVLSPRDATIVRTTWNFKYNGNSLELRYADGTLARYLHLEGLESGLAAGVRVTAGQQVARSGNTGRTNAPHLHYELEQAGRVIDPVAFHGQVRRTLTGDDLEALGEVMAKHDAALARPAATVTPAAPATPASTEAPAASEAAAP